MEADRQGQQVQIGPALDRRALSNVFRSSCGVARDAVTGARRGDGRALLSLIGGIEALVSRSFARSLRDAGWF